MLRSSLADAGLPWMLLDRRCITRNALRASEGVLRSFPAPIYLGPSPISLGHGGLWLAWTGGAWACSAGALALAQDQGLSAVALAKAWGEHARVDRGDG